MTENKKDIRVIDTPVLVLVGPTAVGKTALSLRLAARYGCEIVSVDSMQVYRHMDIGTAKPSFEERAQAVHHLIDIVDPDVQFDAALFVKYALEAIAAIAGKGKIPLLTGGTGMYLKALFSGLFDFESVTDPEVRKELHERLAREGHATLFAWLREVDPATAARIHANDTQRLVRALEIYLVSGKPWSRHLREQPAPPVQFEKTLRIGLSCERKELHRRIEERTRKMFESGLIQEVEALRKMGYTSHLSSMQSIGYRHANNLLDGIWDREETMRLLTRDTRRYAKRQFTWFGSDRQLRWVDREATDEVLRITDDWLND